TLVRPGAVRTLVKFLDEHPDVGIAGSQTIGLDGTPQVSAFRFHTVASELEGGARLGLLSKILHRRVAAPPVRGETHPADLVGGAAMMIRREVFEQIGLLDEAFFVYYEETDF